MKKQSLPLVLAIFLAVSLVGCAEIALQVYTEPTATTQVASSGEQSATVTWDSIPDDATEPPTQIPSTQGTHVQETTEALKVPEITVPAVTEPAKQLEFSTKPVENPTTPTIVATLPMSTQPVTTTPTQASKPAEETQPPEVSKPVEETTPPKQEETPQPTTQPTAQPEIQPPTTEPPAIEPAEVIDIDELVSYGRSYAESTYGYEARAGVRDGYYPAYSCRIRTMEEGYWAVRGCVDDTTRALLARPDTQIVVEINGVLCRAMIDVEIVPNGQGGYWITVYYG